MCNRPSMLMFVYNDLSTDARVLRSLDTLAPMFDITILSIGKEYKKDNLKNVILKTSKTGALKYFDIAIQAIRYGKKHDFQYLYLHDYYSCLVGLGIYKAHKTIYDAHELIIGTSEYPVSKRERFFSFLEKLLISKAQLVICADQKRAEMMKYYYKLGQVPFVVPNYSELPLSRDFSLTSELVDFFNDSRKTFVYAGALIGGRHIDTILYETAKHTSKYKVLIIGDGGEKLRLESIAKECKGLKYLFTGSIPYKNLGMILKHCDVGYLSYPMTNLNNIYCAPNKIYEYASVELPMICNDNPNLISIVGNNGIGVCISEKGVKNCARTIEQALDMIDRDYEVFKKNIRTFRQENSWVRISKQYRDVVQKI